MKNLSRILAGSWSKQASRGDDLGCSVANFSDYEGKKDYYSIKKKFRNIVGVGLVSGIILLGGCAGMNEYDLVGTMFQFGAMSPKSNWTPNQRAGAAALGNLMNNLGNRKHDRELVKEQQRRDYQEQGVTLAPAKDFIGKGY